MGIIIKPLVTEKMTAITDKANNRFGFIVRPEANKLEIKNEVEALYNVTVVFFASSIVPSTTLSPLAPALSILIERSSVS